MQTALAGAVVGLAAHCQQRLLTNPAHRWYFVHRMRPDEMLAFKLYDSDASQPQWTGHTAFTDPDTPPDAPPRQSMELRTVSFIEPA